MSAAIIAAPLRVEAAAVRVAQTSVVRTGMGRRRSLRSRARLGDAPVLVAGVAGGVRSDVTVGHLVVASEVRGPNGAVTVCEPRALVDELRRAGLVVHYGPICCVERLGTPAVDGAIAVEMESCWLAPRAGTPFAVVRAISDTVDAPLLRPAIVRNGLTALRSLRRAVPALDAWAASIALDTTSEVT
jgi:4-hydroxy-3-methylbut-2-enyl diphosphate reductase